MMGCFEIHVRLMLKAMTLDLDPEVNVKNGVGVCIYIRSNRNFRIREDLIVKDLELLIIEIVNPRSRPFWWVLNILLLYSKKLFTDKIDAENSELFLVGDLNCNILSNTPNFTPQSSLAFLKFTIFHGQLLNQPE